MDTNNIENQSIAFPRPARCKTITVGGIKGGTGKTTLATNLAVMRSLRSADVVLIDADEQGTATDFTNLRNEHRAEKGGAGYLCSPQRGKAVRDNGRAFQQKYGTIFIDTGGRDTEAQRSALLISDVLIVPCQPRSYDLWSMDGPHGTVQMVREMMTVNERLRVYTFVNRADFRGGDNLATLETLRATTADAGVICLEMTVGNRKAFANAATDGMGVIELARPDKQASEEIENLYKIIFESEPDSQ